MTTATCARPLESEFESLRRRRPVRIRLLLRDARDILEIARKGGFLDLGYSSLGDLAESLGFSANEGRQLLAIGRVLDAWPHVEERLLDGRLNPDKVASLARLLDVPEAIGPGEDWLALAEDDETGRFQRRVNQRIEEARCGVPVEKMAFWVTARGKEDFRQARKIACRRADRYLSRCETLELLANHYLDAEDPRRVEARERRLGDTAEIQGRTIPEAVKRSIRERAGDSCEFPRCGYDTWLEFAHIVPHRLGGSREADNLLLLCTRHHSAVDGGFLTVRVVAGRALFLSKWAQVFDGPLLLPRPPDG